MRILVTGANGMLGESIRRVFGFDRVIYTDKAQLDVSDYDKVMSYREKLSGKIGYVLHLAAETDLEACERNPGDVSRTNVIGTLNMRLLADALQVPLVYTSTAGVFSGDRGEYTEYDSPCSINNYGRSKWYGEICVRQYRPHYIFRLSWAMGGGPEKDKKFVNKIVKLIRTGSKEIQAISDVYGSPTYHYDVARTIRACLIEKIPYGTYHTAGIGRASRYDVACEIVKILGAKVKVRKVHSEYFNKNFPCPRARNEVLKSVKPYPSFMRDWRESLKEYLEEYYA